MKIAFLGTPRFAQIILEKLVDSPYQPSLVITALDAKIGRGRKSGISPVKQTALAHHIKIIQPTSSESFKSLVSSFKFDLAILAAYGKIIPKGILAIPKYGFINVHPSLLPKYRGPSPIQSAILAGEKKTGISVMLLDKEIDHGPILAQKEIALNGDDTYALLIEKLGSAGAELLFAALPKYLEGTIVPKPQDHKKAAFTKHITKQDGYIDLNNPPDAKTLDRMIKAYFPWPNVWTKIDGKIIKLLPPTIPPSHYPNKPFMIQPEGKRVMTLAEFKNGYMAEFLQIKRLLGEEA